ncbi:hypothetical protein E6C64_17650 [Naasia lichenicola]|uniref:Uncharacterized protein n=1 Tax=Naasia lichenicola TaxID=2565933 RepID=A0A4S4FEV3_9MICO|nr:hypothetical protein E6C64_17650 [Naasia lichenicola]
MSGTPPSWSPASLRAPSKSDPVLCICSPSPASPSMAERTAAPATMASTIAITASRSITT